MSFHATDYFPFGDIALTATSSVALDRSLSVRRVEITPDLPDGMAVDFVTAFLIELVTSSSVHDFAFDCRLVCSPSKGDPNSGENLDAQSWSIGNGLLMIGTEDCEALRARMTWLDISLDNDLVSYLRDGFRLTFPYIPAKRQLSFHFVIAYNQIDKHCDSEWFAVDIPHANLQDSPNTVIKGWP